MAIFGALKRKPMFGQIPGMMQPEMQPDTFGQVGAMQPNMMTKKPGFFGQGQMGRHIAGFIGDALQQIGGGEPTYMPNLMDMRQQDAMIRARLAEAQQKQKQDRENFLFEEGYKRQNPLPAQPTEFERLVRSSGLPEDQQVKLMQDYVRNRANPIQGVPFTDEQGNTGLQFIRPNAVGSGGPAAPTSQAEYEALPAGAQYRAPDGSIRTKGGGGSNVTGGFRG